MVQSSTVGEWHISIFPINFRYSEEEDQQVRNVKDDMIGTYGVFATIMAVRCGETQRITEIYKTIAAKAKFELDKQD